MGMSRILSVVATDEAKNRVEAQIVLVYVLSSVLRAKHSTFNLTLFAIFNQQQHHPPPPPPIYTHPLLSFPPHTRSIMPTHSLG